jgi:hypothetical protein
VPGIEAVVMKKIEAMPLEMSPDLIKIAAWIHTLSNQASRQICESIVRARFVEPFAMSHDAEEYSLALETSSMLSDPGYALAVLRGEVLKDFSHRAGDEGAKSDWESERLVKSLESVVNARKAQENRVKTMSISGEFEKGGQSLGEEDDLGGLVDAEAAEAYRLFTGGKNRTAA